MRARSMGRILIVLMSLPLLAVACAPRSEPIEPVLPLPATLPSGEETRPPATNTPRAETVRPEETAQVLEQTETAEPTIPVRQVEFEAQSAAVEFTLPMTIQHISQTGAWLFFELESPVAGEVFYWVEGMRAKGVSSIEFSAATARHIVELSELLPDTSYRVRVGLPTETGNYRSPGLNGEVWGETLLNTYPEQIEHLRVAVIGDSGFGESMTYALTSMMAARQPDFVIHTGDIVYSAYENGSALQAFQAKYFWPFQRLLLQAPIYAVPGNHEYYGDASFADVPYYFYVFPPLKQLINDGSWVGSEQIFRNWFAVRLMDYQFLFLDSQRFYRPEGTAEQTEWLRGRLAEHGGENLGIYHIATYTSGKHARDGLPIQRSWIPYLREAGAAIILSGHDHNYERLSVDGIEYVVSGGGSRKLYGFEQPAAGSQVFAAESHFVILDIYADRIEIESVNAFGGVFDRHTLEVVE